MQKGERKGWEVASSRNYVWLRLFWNNNIMFFNIRHYTIANDLQ